MVLVVEGEGSLRYHKRAMQQIIQLYLSYHSTDIYQTARSWEPTKMRFWLLEPNPKAPSSFMVYIHRPRSYDMVIILRPMYLL